MICQINNDNFYEYYQLFYGIPAWTPGCTCQPTIVFNGNGIVKVGIDIGLCDNNNEYEICNGMYDIFILCFVFLVLVFYCICCCCLTDEVSVEQEEARSKFDGSGQ